jgi:prepilin-type N-terminal cleavage/methylation domain-containing protein
VKRLNQDGFTIPEMITVLVVTSVLSGLIIFFTFSYWRYGAMLEADMDTFVTRLNSGDVLREMISSSSGMIIQNSLADPNKMVPDPDDGSGTYWLPIHAIPGSRSVGSPGTYTSVAYFKRFSFTSSNTIIMNGLQPYEDEYILYLDGTTKELKLRSLANPAASGNKLLTSCPPALASSSCPADRTVASDVETVDLRFFSRTGNLIDYTSVFDPDINQYIGPDYPVVEVMEFKLTLTKKPFLQTTNSTRTSTIIRIALRNT